MLDASVLARRLVRGGELLVAESLVIGDVIDHPMADSGVERWRMFKIDQVGGSHIRLTSVAQKDAEQRAVHAECPVVIDETQLSELVHEEADPRPGCPNHFGERLLTDFRG